jgi:hypothetical protein
MIRAGIEVEGNDGRTGETATACCEGAGLLWPQYVRGQGYLRQRAAPQAAAEFKTILDRRGQAPLSPLYPLAHLGAARAAALMRDLTSARKAYQAFFDLWKMLTPTCRSSSMPRPNMQGWAEPSPDYSRFTEALRR